jgi:phage terminase small subunit
MTELTPRQRRFAEAYAACGNASEAARRAGYSIQRAPHTGARLMKNGHVIAKITELQAEATARAEIEVDDVIDMLLASYTDAKTANQHGPAVRCAELLGKHLSMFTDRLLVEEQGVSDDDLVESLAGGDEQKRAMLRAVVGAGDTFDA